MAIILFPLFSGLLASSKAAQVAAPDEIPAKIPSFLARLSKVSPASSSLTGIISSIKSVFRILGTNPAPIPWILWGPFSPLANVCEENGSTATILISGFSSFNASAIPSSVPPIFG